MNALLVISIIQAILRYGPDAVLTIADAMQKSSPTPEDIKNLFIDKEPEDFFK